MRKVNGARQDERATAADITKFIADSAISMASSLGVITHPWCGMSRAIRFSDISVGLSVYATMVWGRHTEAKDLSI